MTETFSQVVQRWSDEIVMYDEYDGERLHDALTQAGFQITAPSPLATRPDDELGLAMGIERYMSDWKHDHGVPYEEFTDLDLAKYVASQLVRWDWIKW